MMITFITITLIHLAEHIFQLTQLYVLHWDRMNCLGLLGMLNPWLMRSEWLHFGYALIMCFWLGWLRPSIPKGKSRYFWTLAFLLQIFHYFEHSLLFLQARAHHYLFGSKIPISLGQLFIPKIELHFSYTVIVMIPMIIALYLYKGGDRRKTQKLIPF